MKYSVLLDITACGSDCAGDLNNPIASQISILDEHGECVKFISHYIIPEEKFTLHAQSISGITPDEIEKNNPISLKDYLHHTYVNLKKCLEKRMILVGFNHISYDLKILNDHFEKVLGVERLEWPEDLVLDVQTACEKTMPFREIGVYSIEACTLYTGNDPRGNHHNQPWFDNENVMKILKWLMEYTNSTSIQELTLKIKDFDNGNDEIPFGKHKGQTVEQIFLEDQSYINWLLRNKDVQRKHPRIIEQIKTVMSKGIEQ